MCLLMCMERDRVMGHTRTPVLKKYERICFDREQRTVYGKPTAELGTPRSPAHGSRDPTWCCPATAACSNAARCWLTRTTTAQSPCVLFMLDHSVRETASTHSNGGTSSQPKDVSRRLQFVEMTARWSPPPPRTVCPPP
jgi:hypothetical protein